MEEKTSEKDINRYNLIYVNKSKILFCDDLFLYFCYLTDG